MIIDNETFFAKAAASVRGAGIYYAMNKILDQGNAKGQGYPQGEQKLVIVSKTAFLGGTSVEFQLVGSDTPWTDAAGTGATNVAVLASTGAIPEAALTLNTVVAALPLPIQRKKQYIGIRAIGVGTHTAGDYDALLAVDVPTPFLS
jgi:hypothetical protein